VVSFFCGFFFFGVCFFFFCLSFRTSLFLFNNHKVVLIFLVFFLLALVSGEFSHL